MLQIYDRVLPGRSVPTLVALSVLAAALFAFQAVLDIARNRVLTRVAGGFVEQLDRRVYDLVVKLPLHTGTRLSEPARDLEQVRAVHGRRRPGGAVRPAMDAVLSRHLLPVSSADRPHRHGRRPGPGRLHRAHRVQGPPADAGSLGHGVAAQPAGRDQPQQRRGAACHGHGRPLRRPVVREHARACRRPAARRRRHRRPGRAVARLPHDAAVGGARSRRLAGDPEPGHGRHHHRGLDPGVARAGADRGRDRASGGCSSAPARAGTV